MKVKIKKTDTSYSWYANMIDEIIEVNEDKYCYWLKGDPSKFILKNHCEIIKNKNGVDIKEIKDVSGFDVIKKPSHYVRGNCEVIKVIEAFDLDYHTGNAIKYILRSKFKNNEIEDLQKAKRYLSRKINKLQGKNRW